MPRGLQLRTAGCVVVIAGGLVFVAAVALVDWAQLPRVISVGGTLSIVSHGANLWDFKGHHGAVLTVVAAGTVAFTAMGLLSRSVITALPATCGSFYLLGQTFPIGGGYGDYRAGFWIATVAATAMSIAGVLAVVGAASLAGQAADRP